MATLKLPDSGQQTELPDDIARDDNRLREALAIFLPGASNLDIKREETNGQLVVSVIKRAGSKGAMVSGWELSLRSAPEEVNPALAMLYRLKAQERQGTLTLNLMLSVQAELRQALEAGDKEVQALERAQKILRSTRPIPSRVVPEGF